MGTTRKWGENKKQGGGDANVLKLGDSNRIRLLDPEVNEWLEHVVEGVDDPDQAEFLTCPGAGRCPLCRKPVDKDGNPRWTNRRRSATNVWDYESGTVKVLIAGPQVFAEFDGAAKVGFDPTECDWVIHRTGSGRSTKYSVVRGDKTAGPDVQPGDLHDLSKYGRESTEEEIFEALEKLGYDYDALEVPEFDASSALEFVWPYGKYKGLTMEQVLAQDDSYVEYMHNFLIFENGKVFDPVSLAVHAVLLERGQVKAIEEIDGEGEPVNPSLPAQQPKQSEPAAQEGNDNAADPDPEVEKLRSPDGSEVVVPVATVDDLLAAGFTRPEPEQPEPEPEPEIDDDTMVQVVLGESEVPMKFGVAVTVMNSGQAIQFPDPEVDKAAQKRLPFNQDQSKVTDDDVEKLHTDAAKEMEGGEPVQAEPEPDKPFGCQFCDWHGKTQGALTAHVKREHADAEPINTTKTSNGNGSSGDRDSLLEEVRHLLSKQPSLQKDYAATLDLFDRVAGKRNITDFDEGELTALKSELEKMGA